MQLRYKIPYYFYSVLAWMAERLEYRARKFVQYVCRLARLKRYDPEIYESLVFRCFFLGVISGMLLLFFTVLLKGV